MPYIEITDEINTMIRDAADPTKTFRDTAVPLPNGNWRIEVDDELFARLKSHLGKDETYDDVLRRMLTYHRGGFN